MKWLEHKLADVEQALRYLQNQIIRTAKVPLGSGAQKIRFTIESVYGDTAEVTVDGWSCRGSNPASYSYTITVYDAIGCLLDEDADALIGRQGYAERMFAPVSGQCRWEITSLCCPTVYGANPPI
jgi:hypothetical protein